MKEKMQKKLEAQRAVKEVMEHHLSAWQSVSALASLYDRFVKNLKKIEDYLVVAQQDLGSMKSEIPGLKKQLADRLYAVSNALGVYAAEEGDRKLIKLTDKKLKELKNLNPDRLLKHGYKTLNAGKKLSEMDLKVMKKPPKHHISGYGLTEKHFQLLEQVLEAFEQALNGYRGTKLEVKRSKAKMAKKIQENDQLLRRKIDRMILLFREINPQFYHAFVQARKSALTTRENNRAADKVPEGDAAAAKKPAVEKTPAVAKKPVAAKKPAGQKAKPAANTSKTPAEEKQTSAKKEQGNTA